MNKLLIYACIYIISVFIASISQIMLKKSALKQYDSKIIEYINPLVISAYILLLVSSLLTMISYKYIPLSLGAILESTGYIFIVVLSYIFLKEKLSKRKFVGMILILLGVSIAYMQL